jgi:hypothetical protein
MFDWNSPWLFGIVVALGLLALLSWNQPRAWMRSAQFEACVPGYGGAADPFYTLLYERLQSDLTRSALPFSALSFGPRHLFASRHIFSARPVYLEVRCGHLSYFVYAIPAPSGLYVSAWLFSKHEKWQSHPLLKWVVAWRLAQMTLFQYDIMRLFHVVVQDALTAVLDELREDQGLPPLEAYEKRPVLSGFYASMCGGRSGPGMVAPLSPGYNSGSGYNSSPGYQPNLVYHPHEERRSERGDDADERSERSPGKSPPTETAPRLDAFLPPARSHPTSPYPTSPQPVARQPIAPQPVPDPPSKVE